VSGRGAAKAALVLPVLALAVGLIVGADDPPFWAAPLDYLFDAVTGVVIAVAGFIAWDRRPAWRTGPLLVLAGYLWYVGSLYVIGGEGTLIPFLGFALRGYYDVILAFVVLTVPGDRLRGRLERTAVVLLFATMGIRTIWRLIGTQPGIGPGNGQEAPANPFLLVADVDRFIAGDLLLSFVVGLALWFVAFVAVRRLLRGRRGARRITDPVLIGGALWAVLAGLYAVSGLISNWFGFDVVPTDGPGWTFQYLVRVLGPLGLLIGMARLRSGSSAAVAILAGHDRPPRIPELERALRQALGDPDVRLLAATPNGGWITTTGEPASLPTGDDGRAATIIESAGVVTGAVIHDDTLLDDRDVLRTVAAVVRLAADNERLQDDLRAQLEEVRASRARIVEAGDTERRRVERDLHDGAQQRLVALAVSLRTIRTRLGAGVSDEVAAELDAAAGEVRAAIAELRELARGLDPAILREAGLGPAVQSLADRSPVPVTVELRLDGRMPRPVETAAYFVASEALANVAKHARASAVTVRARRDGDALRLEVEDDGVGGADLDGNGLRGLVDRVAALGGTFTVSAPTDGGTAIAVTIPCAP
jgi:signal transduction histidine kinase